MLVAVLSSIFTVCGKDDKEVLAILLLVLAMVATKTKTSFKQYLDSRGI